jgi:hypothetical protein
MWSAAAANNAGSSPSPSQMRSPRMRARTFIAARCGELDVAPTAVPGDAAAR